MQRLEEALLALDQAAVTAPRSAEPWLQLVRDRLAAVEAGLLAEGDVATDPWLAARTDRLARDRARLVARAAVLTVMLEDDHRSGRARERVRRLVRDVHHHHARSLQLAYDDVTLDVGGSD